MCASAPTPGAVAELAERHHLAVVPVPPGARRPRPGWQDECTAEAAQIRQHWPHGANLGVGCRASWVVVLDIDGAEGTEALAALAPPEEAPTLTVATPSGGRHLYYRAPAQGPPIMSGPLAPGIDVRAPGARSGGYVLGPGSVTGRGAYVIAREAPVRPLPQWAAAALVRRPPRPRVV